MKKFLKTIVIPLLILMAVIGLFGAGWWWGATHTQAFAGMAPGEVRGERIRPGFDGQRLPPEGFRPERFDGLGRGGPSLTRGLAGIVGSLVKLAVIVILVLLVQRGLAWFDAWRANRKTPPIAPPAEPEG